MYGFERLIKANSNIEVIKKNLETREEKAYEEIQAIKNQLEEAETEAETVKAEMAKKKSKMIGTLSYDPAVVYIMGMTHAFIMTSENALLKVIANFIIDYLNGDISELEFHTYLSMEMTNGINSMKEDDNLVNYLEEIYEFLDKLMIMASIDKTESINSTSYAIINDITETLTHVLMWLG